MGNTRTVSGYIRQADNVCFVIGAGASKSAGIPLASELVAQVLRDYAHCLDNLTDSEKADYGKVMSQLSPQEREALISPLLENSGISWGQIALACLITNGKISRVLTFNFDLVLERSISLLGGQFPIYDFGTSPTSEVGRIASPAIIHLHGQSHGLVLLNTDEETQKHKDALRPLISDTIRNNITIVIGYSGEADAAFDLFQSEYNSHNRLVWLGYSAEPGKHLKPLLDQDYAEYIGDCDFDQTMMSIATELGVWPPAIFGNPMNHLLDELSLVKKFPLNGQAEEFDVLKRTTSRLLGFSKQWDAEKQPDDEAFSSLIDGKRGSLSADWLLENYDVLSEEARNAISWDIIRQADIVSEEAISLSGKAASDRFTESYAKYAAALEVKPDQDAALNNWGNTLAEEAKTLIGNAAGEKFAESYAKYAAALAIKPDDHEILFNWGVALSDEATTLSGVAAAKKFAETYAKYAAAMEVKQDDHEALFNWGVALEIEARTLSGKAAARKFTESIAKYAAVLEIKHDSQNALIGWANMLLEEAKTLSGNASSKKYTAAYSKYSAALETEPDNYHALANWGLALLEEGKTLSRKAMLLKFRQAEGKISQAKEIEGKASYNLACVYSLTGRREEAIDELYQCQKDDTLEPVDFMSKDTDLDPLRKSKKFQKLMDGIKP